MPVLNLSKDQKKQLDAIYQDLFELHMCPIRFEYPGLENNHYPLTITTTNSLNEKSRHIFNSKDINKCEEDPTNRQKILGRYNADVFYNFVIETIKVLRDEYPNYDPMYENQDFFASDDFKDYYHHKIAGALQLTAEEIKNFFLNPIVNANYIPFTHRSQRNRAIDLAQSILNLHNDVVNNPAPLPVILANNFSPAPVILDNNSVPAPALANNLEPVVPVLNLSNDQEKQLDAIYQALFDLHICPVKMARPGAPLTITAINDLPNEPRYIFDKEDIELWKLHPFNLGEILERHNADVFYNFVIETIKTLRDEYPNYNPMYHGDDFFNDAYLGDYYNEKIASAIGLTAEDIKNFLHNPAANRHFIPFTHDSQFDKANQLAQLIRDLRNDVVVNSALAPVNHNLAPVNHNLAPVVNNPPAPVVNNPPAPVVNNPPAPVVNNPPAPVVNNPPAPVVNNPPAPVVNNPPAPVVNNPPAPVVNNPPAPVVNNPPAPVVNNPPAPVVNNPPAPVVNNPPAPVVNNPPAPVVNNPPAPVVNNPPAPVVNNPPAPVVNNPALVPGAAPVLFRGPLPPAPANQPVEVQNAINQFILVNQANRGPIQISQETREALQQASPEQCLAVHKTLNI